MKEIQSPQHPLVKKALSLRLDRKEREKNLRVLISGKKLITDLSASWPIEIIFYTTVAPTIRALEAIRVDAALLKKITGLQEPDGWAAIVPSPEEQNLAQKNHILVLDQISDPGNLGTLWRTALAFGWDGIWLTPGCVDPLNDKALRAAQGATFLLPFERTLPSQIVDWARNRKATIYTADLSGASLTQGAFSAPRALVLGSEAHGPGDWTKGISSLITIPISQSVESLNVACAGAILLFAMRPVP